MVSGSGHQPRPETLKIPGKDWSGQISLWQFAAFSFERIKYYFPCPLGIVFLFGKLAHYKAFTILKPIQLVRAKILLYERAVITCAISRE